MVAKAIPAVGVIDSIASRAAEEARRPIAGWKRTRIRELDEDGEPTGKQYDVTETGVQATAGGVVAVGILATAGAAALWFLGLGVTPDVPRYAYYKYEAGKQGPTRISKREFDKINYDLLPDRPTTERVEIGTQPGLVKGERRGIKLFG